MSDRSALDGNLTSQSTTDERDAAGQAIRCPHCHNPIRLGDTRSDEVLCPACGSTFHLYDTRPTSTTSPMQQLGKFQLLERVGVGAFGAVWKARDTELDRIVALKLGHAGRLTSAADQERFQREARAAAQLRHPNIVTVHEVATLNELPALVCDFVQGVPLRDLMQVRRLTFRESAALTAELAEALDYAHRMGVIHRDVKPANVLLERGAGADGVGKPLLADFGLALREDAEITLTVEGQVLGTPAYMSPEQAAGKGHRVDGRSDVYSLGVVLYELLTGELPFRGSKAMILDQVLREEPRRPRRLNDKVPRDLETICLEAMAKEPARRYASARQMADDLRRFLRGEPIQARPVGRLERAWRWCKRNPALAVLSLLSAVAALTLVGVIGVSAAIVYSKNRGLEWTNKKLDEQRQRADEERERVETTLARSLLRPLGHERSLFLNSAELQAVWELAENTSDRVQLLFIADALRRPETAQQLRNRRDWAVHAVVGLDRDKRHRVEEILLARLRDRQTDERVRGETVLIGTSLGSPGPVFAQEAARVLVEVMTKNTDIRTLPSLAKALSSLAGRLEPHDAATLTAQAASIMVETKAKKTTDLDELYSLAMAFKSVAGRLEPAEAATLSANVVEFVAKNTNPNKLCFAAWALEGRLEPHQAAPLAAQVVELMAKTTDPFALGRLAEALSSLVDRLEPAEAAWHTAQAARMLVETMDKRIDDFHAVYSLTYPLWSLAGRLEPAEAAPLAAKVVQAMAKTTHPEVLVHLAHALSSLAGQLEPHQAATLVAESARRLVEMLINTGEPNIMSALAYALPRLAGWLEPAEAATLSGKVVEAMAKATDRYALPRLARALSSLAGRLDPHQAATLARKVVELMAKTIDPHKLPSLAQGLSSLAGQLEPHQAATHTAQAARTLVETLPKIDDPYVLYSAVEALSSLAGRLEPAEATTLTPKVVEVMAKTTGPHDLSSLAKVLSSLAGRLEPQEAAAHTARATRVLVDAMTKATDPSAFLTLARALSSLATRLEPPEAANRAVLVARTFCEEASPLTRLSGLATLLQASQPSPCRLTMQELVDLLKMPTCVGPGRDVILQMLGQKCNRHFADLWQFVDYAHERLPDIDLTSPPKRPQP